MQFLERALRYFTPTVLVPEAPKGEAQLDSEHVGDIRGGFGTIGQPVTGKISRNGG